MRTFTPEPPDLAGHDMKTIADDIAIRPLREDEVHLLRDFLYEAVFVPEVTQPPPRDIVDLPALQVYIRGFGEEKDDLCLVAEHHGRAIGAVWSRIMNDYGHIDGDTPSLAISLYKGYRNKGIGTRLLSAMLKLLSESGYHKVSLSVQKANSAVRMYERSGFKTIRTTGEEYVMVKDLSEIYSMRPLTEQDIPEMQELFRKETRICQSCGRLMPSEDVLGTHGDGHPCTEYCRDCFQNGLFTSDSIEEQRKAIAASERRDDPDLRTLKRWMPVVQQAAWILDRCGYVILSTIDGNGFPRPVAIDVLRHDGIAELWMTTALSSEKVKHLRNCPKAGICYVHEADSVTLTGTAGIITDKETLHAFWCDYMVHYFPEGPDDPDYCILRFRTQEATLWIDRKSAHLTL